MSEPTAPGSRWVDRPDHRAWLAAQARSLLAFFRSTVTADGRFVELDEDGNPLPTGCPPATKPQQNLLTVCRTVHCYALGQMLGIPGCAPVVERGLRALAADHHDPVDGGWFNSVGSDGPVDSTKAAYTHAHVLLAASSALQAGHGGAQSLLDGALAVIDDHFWDGAEATTAEAFSRDWRELEDYRGANSHMHLCESLLAAADATGRGDLAERAARIARRLIDGHARAHDWLLPEHYDRSWQPDLDYNRDQPDHPFRPFGATIGHSLEWARLLLGVGQAMGEKETWVLDASVQLFTRAVTLGWDDRRGGLVYTVGWDEAPVNDDHYWWPVAEGISVAAALHLETADAQYEAWYRRFWDYAATVMIDHRRGGWYPQFDADNRPKVHPWYGKPDIYHCLQATILPLLPAAPSVAGAIRRSQQGA